MSRSLRSRRLRRSLAALLASTLTHASAWAIEPARVQADSLTIDADDREVVAKGNVRVDAEPFHLQSDALTLTRSWRGIEIDGSGKLSFCRCLSFPLSLVFRGGAVGPPYDLLLKRVRLELYGVPLFYLPLLWIRAPARAGLLIPELAYRGVDGVYGSVGAHLPLPTGSMDNGLDVRVGGYFRGGFASEVHLRTAHTYAALRLDTMRAFERRADGTSAGIAGTGLTVDARGSVRNAHNSGVAWDADALMGPRAVYATTSLENAARPFDRAQIEATALGEIFALSTGVRTIAPRGSGLGAELLMGPYAALALRGASFGVMTLDARAEGGVLGRYDHGHYRYVRGEAGVHVAEHAGPIVAELRARGAGSWIESSAQSGAWDGAIASELTVGVPLARGFGAGPWPLRHRLEPRVGGRVLAAHGEDPYDVAAGRGLRAVRGAAAVAETSVLSSMGRLGTHGAWDLELAAGVVSGAAGGTARGENGSVDGVAHGDAKPRAVLRVRQALSAEYAALIAEGALASAQGAAVAAHGRLGSLRGVSLRAHVFAARGLEPTVARLLVDPLREAPSAWVGREGITGGLGARVPFTSWLAADGGVDADLQEPTLLGARAGLELRDRCGCFVVRLAGSQRLGRAGTDVWLAVDLMPAGKI